MTEPHDVPDINVGEMINRKVGRMVFIQHVKAVLAFVFVMLLYMAGCYFMGGS